MIKEQIDFSKIPDEPGVYFFKRGRTVLYVGKATSLRSRVRSYFDGALVEKRSPLVVKAVADATRMMYQETDTVLDALLLEAQKIKELTPIGNTDAKDDKSYNYVIITTDEFPRILTVRGRELKKVIAPAHVAHLFGPFTQGGQLKEALKIVRRIFPYFDTKFPITNTLTPQQAKTVRFYQSIGIFPTARAVEYRKTIRHIVLLFEAKKKKLIQTLESDMIRAARKELFEEAKKLKRQLFALKHIQDVTLIKPEYRAPHAAEYRIEAYDTSHLAGSAARGVMAVVIDGEPEKKEYRTFTIRMAKAGDDYAALTEILTRRFSHPEWLHPDLIVIDGGRGQLGVARKALLRLKLDIQLVSVVKDEHHRPREILGKRSIATDQKASILLANAEAHRFSLARHRYALRKRI